MFTQAEPRTLQQSLVSQARGRARSRLPWLRVLSSPSHRLQFTRPARETELDKVELELEAVVEAVPESELDLELDTFTAPAPAPVAQTEVVKVATENEEQKKGEQVEKLTMKDSGLELVNANRIPKLEEMVAMVPTDMAEVMPLLPAEQGDSLDMVRKLLSQGQQLKQKLQKLPDILELQPDEDTESESGLTELVVSPLVVTVTDEARLAPLLAPRCQYTQVAEAGPGQNCTKGGMRCEKVCQPAAVEEHCTNHTTEVCQDVPHEICEEVTERFCTSHAEEVCQKAGGTEEEEDCEVEMVEECEQVEEKECREEARMECKEVEREACTTISERVCSPSSQTECRQQESRDCNLVQDVVCRNETEARFGEKCWVEQVEDCTTVWDTVTQPRCQEVNITVPGQECQQVEDQVEAEECRVVETNTMTEVCVTVEDTNLVEVH